MKWLAIAMTVSLVGCAGTRRVVKPASPTDEGFAAYFDGHLEKARTDFDRALKAPPGAPVPLEALYGRALVDEAEGNDRAAFDGFVALLEAGSRVGRCETGCGESRWPDLAIAAARRLESLRGEVGDQRAADAEARLAALVRRPLPLAVQREVAALAAAWARQAGDEAGARKLDEASGCPDHFWQTGSYGRLPRLDLARDFPPDHDARDGLERLSERGCRVSVSAPSGKSGVVYAVGWFRAARPEQALVTVETDTDWRLYVDGRPAYTELDLDRFPPRERELEVPLSAGWHRVAVKLGAPGGRAEAALSLLADPPLEPFAGSPAAAPAFAPAAPVHAQALEPPPPTHDALSLLLAIEHALSVEDVDRGEAALDRLRALAPKSAEVALLAAELALADPSRPPNIVQDRARRALERALALDPRQAQARGLRAQMSLSADRPREALELLDAAPRDQHPWRFAYVRYQALKARGWLSEAEHALADALRLAPAACQPMRAKLALDRERRDLRDALRLAPKVAQCGGGSDALADLLRSTGNLDGAIAEYRRLLSLDPSRELWQASLAETLAQAGKAQEAAERFGELARRYPRVTAYRRQLADALEALGDEAGARRALEAGLGEVPESRELRRALEALCTPDGAGPARGCGLMDPFRVDGKAVIAAYQRDAAARPAYSSPAVIVLDRTVTRVFPTGARLTLTHNIIQVLAKDGIDKWGEVQIPDGADVLTLRTVKADGTTREPEEIEGKESVSVPDLEVGDYVELEYVDPSPPPAAFPGGFLAERFYFRSYDAPLDRTEYLLVTPAGMPIELDRRGDAPAIRRETRTVEGRKLDVRTWAARHQPQAFAEPAAAPFTEFLPSVRPGSGLSAQGWRDFLRDGNLEATRGNGELRALAARLTRGATTPRAKLDALDAWVRRNVKDGGALAEPATSILARLHGNRVTLLAALLRAAGVPSEVWLVRPASAPVLDGPLPDLEDFDQPILSVAGELVDPRFRHSPTGFVTPALRGRRALPLAPGPLTIERVAPTAPPAIDDDRHMDLTAALAADGSAEVRVRERLRGWPAVEWREALEKLPPDRVRPEFEQRTLGFYFPGSTLEALTWNGADDDGGPFTVEYRFHAPQLARRMGDRLILPAPYPALLGQRYVGVATRSTPLRLEYASPTTLTAEVALPPGAEVEVPPPIALEPGADGFGRFEQAAERTAHGLTLKARFAMPRRTISPARYPAFVDFAARIDRAEARAAEIRLPAGR